MSFAQERARKEVCEVAENHRIDPQYEELDEAFEYDDRYIAPLVTYLTYKLRLALLQRNAGKRKRGIWWVLVHVEMQGYYVEIFLAEFVFFLLVLRGDMLGGVREAFDGTSGCVQSHAAHGICTDVER